MAFSEGKLPMRRVTQINTLAELEALRLDWDLLLGQTPGGTWFHSLDWLLTYWRHCGQQQELRVLVVWEDRRPAGILPLALKQEATRLGQVRVLTYPLDYWSTAYGPIGSQPTLTLIEALKYLQSGPRDWELLDLPYVDRDGSDRGRTERALEFVGFPPQTRLQYEVPVIDTADGWEAYFASRSSKLRKSLRYNLRRLSRRGAVSITRHRPAAGREGDGQPRWDLYDACVAISEHCWQSRCEHGTTLAHGRVRNFLRDVHEVAAARGQVDLSVLAIDKQPVAFCYGFHRLGLWQGFRQGYLPEAPEGAGSVLWAATLQGCFERGDRLIDLGADASAYKQAWSTGSRRILRHVYHGGSWRGQLLRSARWVRERLGLPERFQEPKSRREATEQGVFASA